MNDLTILVRNRDSVHRRECRYNVTGTPWKWAEGKTRDEVASAADNGLRFCKVCRPLDAFNVSAPTYYGQRGAA